VDAAAIRRLAGVDAWYGIAAALVLAVGLARVFLGAKGAAYYVANSLFWAKMATFAVIGAISALPTLQILAWRRATRNDPQFRPAEAKLVFVRRALFVEAGLFALLPIFAAGMARGFGA
jgi:putative membrane protein